MAGIDTRMCRLAAMLLALALSLPTRAVLADGAEIIALMKANLDSGDYYSAATEGMRYRFLYPGGPLVPTSLLLSGEAYYRGGNYYEAASAFSDCYQSHRAAPEAESALISLGYIRLATGSPFFALRTYQEYLYVYPEGRFREEADIDACYAMALQSDFDGSRSALAVYVATYPDGPYGGHARELERLIEEEINRPRKNLALSVGGSILIPGFGHFYTGRYLEGFLALFTNSAFLYLIYDAWRDDNKFRMAVFGFAGFTVYQYSLVSSVRNVYEYNSREPFHRSVRLAARRHF
ncbi:MAG: hypothetical protein EHM32_05560 [Spirochaetales bacterium]|nr:MAG: hypothetical protein EHM32_05560 [Spirochaetales bacterium]